MNKTQCNKSVLKNTNKHTSITRAQNSMQTKSMHKMVIHKLNDKTSCHVLWGGFGCILSHNKQTNQQNHQTKAKPPTNPSKKWLSSFLISFSLSLFVLFSASWFVIPINSHSDVVAVLDSHNLAVVVGIVVVVVVVHPFSWLSDTLLRKVHPFVSNSLSTSSLHRSNEVNP